MMATERQAYWQGIIESQVASGLTKAEFFKLNNITASTYYYWFNKLNMKTATSSQKILPITITPQSPISSQQTVELLLPNGYQLSFEAAIEPANLKQILGVLSA
ncbi:MAG TPA: hypothetical protein VIS54_08485 [Psychromonas sp.]